MSRDEKRDIAWSAVIIAALAALAWLSGGCRGFDANPASRLTTAQITININNLGGSNAVHTTVRDVAQSSADSTGSSETQTAQPTQTVSPSVTLPAAVDPITAGIQEVGGLAKEAIKAGAASKSGAAQQSGACQGGACSLNGGACQGGACSN